MDSEKHLSKRTKRVSIMVKYGLQGVKILEKFAQILDLGGAICYSD